MSRVHHPHPHCYGRLRVAATVAVLFIARGCAPQGEPKLPLVFETPVVDLGVIYRDNTIRQPYRFRVWDEGPVRIEYASTSCCGPKLIEPDLVGEELKPGTEHVMYLRISDSHPGEVRDIVANIETLPVSPRPITIRLRGMLVPAPSIYPRPLLIRQPLGDRPVGELRAQRMRTADLSRLEFDEARSRLAPLKLQKVVSGAEPSGRAGRKPEPFLDSVSFTIGADEPLPTGRHEFTLSLAWKGEQRRTNARVVVEVSHPCRPALNRLFCGDVTPGAPKHFRVPIVRGEWPRPIAIAALETSGQAVSASMSNDEGDLIVDVIAPLIPGRFEEDIKLRFANDDVPEITLPVSGIVVD